MTLPLKVMDTVKQKLTSRVRLTEIEHSDSLQLHRTRVHRKYFDWFAETNHIQTQEQWYAVSGDDVKAYEALLSANYNCSLAVALQAVYPEFIWCPWNFTKAPVNYWRKLQNRRTYLDWVAEQLGIEQQSDWFDVSAFHIMKLNGRAMMQLYYKYCLPVALSEVYPEFHWEFWKFKRVPQYIWKERKNQKLYFDWLAEELEIVTPASWFGVTKDMVRDRHGAGLLKCYGQSLISALQGVFPEHQWNSLSGFSDGHKYVESLLKKLFPNREIQMNFKHPKLYFQNSKRVIELDIYIPSLELAFEYQGGQHFFKSFRASAKDQKERDTEKRKLCAEHGITLIEVPFWWDISLLSLQSTIQRARPDIHFTAHLPSPSSSFKQEFVES